jgi:uncharacterized protein
MDKLTKAFPTEMKLVEGERALIATISTSAVDRDGEVVVAMGCNAKDFERNPVICLSHDYYTLPVGKCVSLKREEDVVTAKIVFADRPADFPADEEWVPSTLFSLYQQGVLNAFSIGFMPIESRAPSKKDIERYGEECRRVHSKWSLLEVSVVPIPANQEAVALAVSKGLMSSKMARDVWQVEAKEPDATLCAGCGSTVDLESVDGRMLCSACREPAKAATIEATPDPTPPQAKRLYVYSVEADLPKVIINRDAQIADAKKRGKLYLYV